MKFDGWELFLYQATLRLKPGREFEHFAKRLKRLIQCESWRISRQFKQHASRFPEIDGVEISSVEDWSHVETLGDFGSPLKLGGVIHSAKGDVMHCAGPLSTIACVRIDKQVDVIAQSASRGGEPNPAILFRHSVEAHELQDCSGWLHEKLQKRDSVEPPDDVLRRNGRKPRRAHRSGVSMTYYLDSHSICIRKSEHLMPESLACAFYEHAILQQMLFPEID